jgi:uncharacterized protein (TIGR02145 family)
MKYVIISVAILTVCLSAALASAQNKVVVIPLGKSGLQAVNDSSSCDAAKAGTIRWTGSDFEGCNGTQWIVFSMPFGTVTSAGQVWMDRNLGASRVATSSSDSAAYGDLYQWGRLTDGHEQSTVPTTTNLSTTDVPGHGSFILALSVPYDWRSPRNDSLWQGVSGINNPCPAGFRLPTEAEWEIERASWSSNDAAGAFASPLKLVMAGERDRLNGTLSYAGSRGHYWSSTVDGSYNRSLYFSSLAYMSSFFRSWGFSVRCLKD